MSELSTGWNLEPSFCRHLKSKDLYLNVPFHPSGFEESEGTPCWCNKTQQCLGPDGDLVDRTACRAGRDCYEADEL